MEDSFQIWGPPKTIGQVVFRECCLESDLRGLKTARSRFRVIHLVTNCGFHSFQNCANWCWKSEAYQKEIKNTRCFLRKNDCEPKNQQVFFIILLRDTLIFSIPGPDVKVLFEHKCFSTLRNSQKKHQPIVLFSNDSK